VPLEERHWGWAAPTFHDQSHYSSDEPNSLRSHPLYGVLRAMTLAYSLFSGGRPVISFTAMGPTKQPSIDHLPDVDLDGDWFSTYPQLRGSHWRGKDCDDTDAKVYAGRKADSVGPLFDHNCNGISGVDGDTGKSYEELYCGGTEYRGMLLVGDSATAHFRIPPQMANPKLINNESYAHLLELVQDEADWPHCSWGTGFASDEECPPSPLHVDSLMLRFRSRNRCNHRDFQNIGVNGARTSNVKPPNGNIISMKPRTGDQPALVIFSLLGNDVCNGHHTFDTMTSPQEFYGNVMDSLHYLDTVLAPNSYVAVMGLVDGRALWNTMHNETHPVGVPYPDFYDYLNCKSTSPCWGWMNSNQTVRDTTWAQHASKLNIVYQQIVQNSTFTNFSLFYIPPNLQLVIDKWVHMGHHARDLIEPVDGFHPSQIGLELLVDFLWRDLSVNFTASIGAENPNNDAIISMFGDQGGF